jgi:hypothetical protein
MINWLPIGDIHVLQTYLVIEYVLLWLEKCFFVDNWVNYFDFQIRNYGVPFRQFFISSLPAMHDGTMVKTRWYRTIVHRGYILNEISRLSKRNTVRNHTMAFIFYEEEPLSNVFSKAFGTFAMPIMVKLL